MSRPSARQLAAVALCAGFAPAMIVGGGLGWTGALLGGGAAALLWCWLLRRMPGGLAVSLAALQGGCVLRVLYLLWNTFFLGWLIRLCEASFPEMTVFPTLPLVLLALAWWASTGGGARLGRVCGVLAAALCALFAIPLAAGVMQTRWVLALPERDDLWRGAALLLSPMPALCLLPAAETRPKAWWTLPLLAGLALCAAVCRSILGADSVLCADPLYEATKSVSLGGVMERFEALVSVALAVSLFAAMALCFAAQDRLCPQPVPRWALRLAVTALAVGVWWIPGRISGGIAQIGSLLFGGLLPTVAIIAGKAGKKENSA